MSIKLLTAVPGGGKTSYAVWHVIKEAAEQGRTVYTIGIPKLIIPTIEITYEYLKTWYEQDIIDGLPVLRNIDHGSLIVVDEVQKMWPALGSQASKDITELSEHRHYGLDFFIMTQSPSLVHKKVLALVNPHLHIVPRWSGRTLYEWPEYRSNTSAASTRRVAVSAPYKLPKESFQLYHSATQHIVHKARLPRAVYIFAFSILFTIAIGAYAFERIVAKGTTVPEYYNIANSQEEKLPEIGQKNVEIEKEINKSVSITPVNSTKVYDSIQILTESVDWTLVKACIKSKENCFCYGHSAERLLIEKSTCEIAVDYGWPGKKV